MSPQFVDFDADGKLDIVVGTFDGSPHLARGAAAGWAKPEQILDRDGARIVGNTFWNYDTKKWDSTDRSDARDKPEGNGHLTSAWAVDWDGDGDLDLLLGDHRVGNLFVRINEGDDRAARFDTVNRPVLANGRPLLVTGTVTTVRAIDWNRDGLFDLLVGSMGDAFQDGPGGGVFLFLNRGTAKAPEFDRAQVLIEPGDKNASEPVRPDSGLYMDAADVDGDGDFDLVVGGYSQFKPPHPPLSEADQARAEALQKQQQDLSGRINKINTSLPAITGDGSDPPETQKIRQQLLEQLRAQRDAYTAQLDTVEAELEQLVPPRKRLAFVWLYENLRGH